jgi:hypothetical protein
MGQFGHAILDSDMANDAVYDINEILEIKIEDGHWRDRADDIKDALSWPGNVTELQIWLRNSSKIDYDIRAMTLAKIYMFAGAPMPSGIRLAALHGAKGDKDEAALWDDYKPRAKIIRSFIATLSNYRGQPTPLDDVPCEMADKIKELQNKPKVKNGKQNGK